ncbi:MAG: 23S rRNA (uracil(1939)-C(5))-methyltransferase RlmD [Bacteroidales bacterium]
MRKAERKPNRIVENVPILEAAAEGNAIAKIEEKVLFVPYAAPGDVADIEILRSKHNYMTGRILRLLKASPFRQDPFCTHFGLCGGCKWQHLVYEEQLNQKQKQVRDHLERIGKLSLPPSEPILGSPQNRYYRNKLEFTFSTKRWLDNSEITESENYTDSDLQGLGFHLAGKFDKVLDLKKCYLQPEPSNEIRLFIKSYAQKNGLSFYDIRQGKGLLRNVIIRNTADGVFMVVLVVGSPIIEDFKGLLEALKLAFPCIASLMYVINTKVNDSIADLEVQVYDGKPFIIMEMPSYLNDKKSLQFRVGPKSFYQTNTEQAQRLYKLAVDMADLRSEDIVYDLYTGTGTIANYVANSVKKVVGIEYVEEAIKDAKINAKENQINNAYFFAGDMAKVLTTEFMQKEGFPEVVITDPPREGMHEKVIDQLLCNNLGEGNSFGRPCPSRIVYISCNSATQARDIQRLDTWYSVEKLQAVDMFPHTSHVESVVLLHRREMAKE